MQEIPQRYENRAAGRYYLVWAQRDLLGQVVICRVWGAIGKANGRMTSEPCADPQAEFGDTHKRRTQRGYVRVA